MNKRLVAVSITLLLISSAVVIIAARSRDGAGRDPRVFLPPADPWAKDPPNTFAEKIQDRDYLPDSEFSVVKPEMQLKAIAMLQTTSNLPLNQATSRLFCPQLKEPPARKRTKPYLVRGLLLNEATGGFSVISSQGSLWIEHGSLGRYPKKMQRRALVVYLKQKPKQVFLTVAMAE